MQTEKISEGLRGLSIGAIVFGILGGAFFWWVPLGMVFSLTGLVFGFVDSTSARRRSLDFRLSLVAILISVVSFCFDLSIALLGLQTVTFGGR